MKHRRAPNQALPEGISLGQADGCQLGTLNMASIGFSLNNFFFSMNSLRWVHIENYQRRSPKQKHFGVNLAPVR
jgi:hypothetical protein